MVKLITLILDTNGRPMAPMKVSSELYGRYTNIVHVAQRSGYLGRLLVWIPGAFMGRRDAQVSWATDWVECGQHVTVNIDL